MKIRNVRWGIWGYGVVGKSVARFLHAHGAHVSIYDQKLLALNNNEPFTIYQPDQLATFLEEQSSIVPSPGVDITNYYATYRKKIVPELDLFYNFFKKPIIAITGSVGKTTITRIISLFLEKSGLNVLTGGNIGLGMCDLIAQQDQCDIAVLEVSSFQLEHIQQFAPTLAVITPFHPNHLDRHKTLKSYRDAKLTILKYQTENDRAVIPQTLKKYAPYASAQIYTYRKNHSDPLTAFLPQLSFKENMNIICAVIHALEMDSLLAITFMRTISLKQEHRLEHVATIDGVQFINDSKATTPVSTLAAVHYFKDKPIHLLLGGLSKGVCRENLIQSLQFLVKKVYCFGSEALQLSTWCQQYGIPTACHTNLTSCIAEAQKEAQKDEIVLLSPGGSSYDLFKDYQERGNCFKNHIHHGAHT
jgi:UDP-N-acetylmuramoylalanine--D-glutamate ligase